MAAEVTLSAAIRSNLLSLSGTERLISRTQERLASGLRVASPIDDARASAAYRIRILRGLLERAALQCREAATR